LRKNLLWEVMGHQPALMGASYFYLMVEAFKEIELACPSKSPRHRLLEAVAAKRSNLLGPDHELTLEAEALICVYLAVEEEELSVVEKAVADIVAKANYVSDGGKRSDVKLWVSVFTAWLTLAYAKWSHGKLKEDLIWPLNAAESAVETALGEVILRTIFYSHTGYFFLIHT
jgi:hypothetical protein